MISNMRGRDLYKRFRCLLFLLGKFYGFFPLTLRKKALICHRSVPGRIGLGIRYALLKSISDNVGDNVAIFENVFLLNPENIVIGSNVSIHPFSYLECGFNPNGIIIGDNVSIAHSVTIMATSHVFDDLSVNIKDQGIESKTVQIEENVWIGAKATVLSGVTISRGCVIGAGAVVTKATEPDGVYVGVPARRIKDRGSRIL